MEGGNILHMQKLCRVQSSAPEVKNGHEERACGTICVRIVLSASPGFYLLSCFYLLFLFLLLLLSSFSCRLRGPQFRVLMPGNIILHIFILQKSLVPSFAPTVQSSPVKTSPWRSSDDPCYQIGIGHCTIEA